MLCGVLLFAVGMVLPLAASALESYEENRVEIENTAVDCELEMPDEEDLDGDGSVQTGTATVDGDCFGEQERALEEAQRGWVLWVVSALSIGGWVLRFGGIIWIWMGLWARSRSRI